MITANARNCDPDLLRSEAIQSCLCQQRDEAWVHQNRADCHQLSADRGLVVGQHIDLPDTCSFDGEQDISTLSDSFPDCRPARRHGRRCSKICRSGEIRDTSAFLRSEEHTSELSHVAISYAVFCLK